MKNIFLLLLICSILTLNAQTDKNVESSQLQLSLPLPSILYELGVGKNTTTSLEAITGFALQGCTGCETNFGIYPILRGQLRYYYNMERRLRKKKNIQGNSGNYAAALFAYQGGSPILGNLNTTNTIVVGPVYGIQRTYKRGFFYRLEGGPAFIQDDIDQGFGLVLAARIGWVLRKRR